MFSLRTFQQKKSLQKQRVVKFFVIVKNFEVKFTCDGETDEPDEKKYRARLCKQYHEKTVQMQTALNRKISKESMDNYQNLIPPIIGNFPFEVTKHFLHGR